MSARIRIGVSSCLLGQEVRYDGGHKYSAFITETLGRIFELVPFCPEVAIGMGVPRPPIRLVRAGRAVHARGVADAALDVTDRLVAYAEDAAPALRSVSGYILKSRSPSCGMERVPLHDSRGRRAGTATGIYARRLTELLPALPCEDEERLMDARVRKAFIERVFVYHRWQQFMAGRVTPRRLAEFHAQHASAVPAGDARTRRALARLVARAGRGPVRDVAGHYLQQLLQALGPAPMRTRRGRSPPRSRGRRTGRWSVYVVRCADDSLYTGVAVDVAQRIARHNSGKGARYTRGRGPVRLVYQEHAGSRSAALKRELAVKRLTPAAKRRLIAGRG